MKALSRCARALWTGLPGLCMGFGLAGLTACNGSMHVSLRPHAIAIGENGGSYYEFDYEEVTAPARLEKAREYPCVARASNQWKGLQLERSIQEIMRGLRAYASARFESGTPIRVVLFLHGGLVPMKTAMQEAKKINELVGDENDGFYPIFMNWETGMPRSYWNDLVNVRRGRHNPSLGIPTAPFQIFADLLRSAGRLPGFLWDQAAGQISRISPPPPREPIAVWKTSVNIDTRTVEKGVSFRWLRQIVPGFMRLLTTPMLDFIGQGAFDDMLRRTRVLFLLDEDFGSERQECGAISRLMNEIRLLEQDLVDGPAKDDPRDSPSRNRGDDTLTQLRALQVRYRALPRSSQAANRNAESRLTRRREVLMEKLATEKGLIRIDIIAHSMGAIVANEILDRHRDLYYENVVYMAAASSIKNFGALALPYLRANPTTRFYVLTLHPQLERREENLASALPNGSLLSWLDSFINRSSSDLDRTLGSWDNIVPALSVMDYLEEDTRNRLIVTGFGQRPGRPRKHGEFNDPPKDDPDPKGDEYPGAEFWKESFWTGCALGQPNRGCDHESPGLVSQRPKSRR